MSHSTRLSRIAVHLALALIIGLTIGAFGCRGTGSSGPINLQGAGATFPNPLYQKGLSEFSKQHSDIRIDYQSI